MTDATPPMGSTLGGILGGPIDGPKRLAAQYPLVDAPIGLSVVHRATRFAGVIVGFELDGVRVRGQSGDERLVRLVAGAFAVKGQAVSLRPVRSGDGASTVGARTASGSVAVATARARVAMGSRIWVEGVHDAELVEKVWGDDLRVEGVVVERLDGIDELAAAVQAFSPGPGRRLGVLVDHLVAGSKEARLAAEVRHAHVLVTGTPFVDVWQAVRPTVARIGATVWPTVPRGEPWKEGVLTRLGRPGDSPGRFWRQLLGSVRSYVDLEPALVGAVESLIDFVTASPA